MDKRTFSGKTALVTGAAAGIGWASAKLFAERGANVVISDIDVEATEAAAKTLRDAGYEAIGIVCDVSDEASVEHLIVKTVEHYGSLDAVFNNAGIQTAAAAHADGSREDYDNLLAVNQFGVWACMKYELRQMIKQGSGAIVNGSSMGGLIGLSGRSVYNATKHAVIGMTKCAALDYASQGIRVNAVCPGTVKTPMVDRMFEGGDLDLDEVLKRQPIGRIGQAEEVAAAVVWLCSPEASFILGQALAVDGGSTV